MGSFTVMGTSNVKNFGKSMTIHCWNDFLSIMTLIKDTDNDTEFSVYLKCVSPMKKKKITVYEFIKYAKSKKGII